eukprot:942175-Rhodomonas_salina.4
MSKPASSPPAWAAACLTSAPGIAERTRSTRVCDRVHTGVHTMGLLASAASFACIALRSPLLITFGAIAGSAPDESLSTGGGLRPPSAMATAVSKDTPLTVRAGRLPRCPPPGVTLAPPCPCKSAKETA